jgi:triacylglycerol esterase/lipase EstA (alpha/beta hydrolase family)
MRETWLTTLGASAALCAACSAHPVGGPAEDDGIPLADAATPAARACDDLDLVLGLDAQVLANADARRGRYPLVLSHGFAGFDRVGPLEYFAGVAPALRARGFAVYLTAVEPVAATEGARDPELARQVACIAERAGAAKLNLVGHSQGGLDARFVAADPDFAGRVATVTTIATPHHGTVLADLFLGVLPGATDDLFNAVAELVGVVVGAPEQEASLRAAMAQMTTAQMAVFNDLHPDQPGVAYFSWGGRSVRSALSSDLAAEACADSVLPNPLARDLIDPLLLVAFDFIGQERGANDGMVDVTSTRWGTFMSCIAADHMDQIGMLSVAETNPFSGFNHIEYFAHVAGDLETRGY